MRILEYSGKPAALRRPGTQALTLVEMMVTMGVFSLMMMGLLYGHMFGLRQDQLVESKLGASDMARKGFEKLANEVRGSQAFIVGTYAGGTFTADANNSAQQGNALQLFLNASNYPNPPYIVYYFDTTSTPGTNLLRRFHSGDAGTSIIASDLTNFTGGALNFSAEDYQGNVQTSSSSYRGVVHFTLGFLQYQFPMTSVKSNALYDYYKIEFRLAPHVPCGR